MQKTASALVITSILTVGLAGCMHERPQSALDAPPGTYEKTTRTTNADGTTVEKTTSTKVEVEDDGDKKAVVKSKTTEDPKGWFNTRTTSKSKVVLEEHH